MTNANTTKFILSETPEMTKKKLRGKLLGLGGGKLQGLWSSWMWSGWSADGYGLYILKGNSSEAIFELLGHIDLAGPAVICALDWSGLVEVWAGLLAFIQLMWVTHLPALLPSTVGQNFSSSFITLHRKLNLKRKVQKSDDSVDAKRQNRG